MFRRKTPVPGWWLHVILKLLTSFHTHTCGHDGVGGTVCEMTRRGCLSLCGCGASACRKLGGRKEATFHHRNKRKRTSAFTFVFHHHVVDLHVTQRLHSRQMGLPSRGRAEDGNRESTIHIALEAARSVGVGDGLSATCFLPG